ncbi:MAG: AhpC/TSA family protein [Spirochaetales bacterium]|nr:AhpC/TSA family protein [Spirochaetales bacterium]
MILPNELVPDFTFKKLNGGVGQLRDLKAEKLLLVIVYRGFHCPICRRYLGQINARLEDFRQLGVEVLVVSTDSRERAQRTKNEWQVDQIDLAYELSIESARRLGLFISRAKDSAEPEIFAEPGLFILRPDQTLFASSIQTMPFTRPSIDELYTALQYILEKNYPARGDA